MSILKSKGKKLRGKRGLTSDDKLGVRIIVICAVILFALLVLFFFIKSSVVTYDAETLCPEDIKKHTILLIDKSDAPTHVQSKYIENIVQDVKNRLQPLEKITILTLSEGLGSVNVLFSKCNPGTGEQANSLYQNPHLIQREFDEKFGAQFKIVEESIKHHGEASQSQILEALQTIGTLGAFDAKVEEKRLLIISDMMQNSNSLSHYQKIPEYSDFAKSVPGRALQADMDDLSVEIYYLPRLKIKSNLQDKHILFWKDYFQQQKASSVKFRKIR